MDASLEELLKELLKLRATPNDVDELAGKLRDAKVLLKWLSEKAPLLVIALGWSRGDCRKPKYPYNPLAGYEVNTGCLSDLADYLNQYRDVLSKEVGCDITRIPRLPVRSDPLPTIASLLDKLRFNVETVLLSNASTREIQIALSEFPRVYLKLLIALRYYCRLY